MRRPHIRHQRVTTRRHHRSVRARTREFDVQPVRTVSLSPTSRAFYVFGHDSTRSAGYLLVVRGQPFWSDAGGAVGGGGRVDGPAPREHTWEAGGQSFTVRYDPRDSTIALAGSRIALDSANVVLLDRNDDAPSGFVVRGAVCAPPLRPDSIAVDLWERVPAAREYVRARIGT